MDSGEVDNAEIVVRGVGVTRRHEEVNRQSAVRYKERVGHSNREAKTSKYSSTAKRFLFLIDLAKYGASCQSQS